MQESTIGSEILVTGGTQAKEKALIAMAHRMLTIIYCMLSRKEPFREQPTY